MTLKEEELDQVAGGSRKDFEDVCAALGKSATWNTRDGIRKLLSDKFGIVVEHWNTGDRGSKEDKEAEFVSTVDWLGYVKEGGRIYTSTLCALIKKHPEGLQA